MFGYLLSFFVTHLLNFLLSLGRLLKITNKQIPLYVPLLAITATALGLGIACLCQNIWVQTLCFPAILFCLLYLFGILRKEDIIWLKSIISHGQIKV